MHHRLPKPENITVFLADDSPILRTRLRELIADVANVEVVGEADNAQDAERFIREIRPDVVIVDIRMPGGDGIGLMERIRRQNVQSLGIILTNYPFSQMRKKSFAAGADFFFDKSTEFDRVAKTLNLLVKVRGEKFPCVLDDLFWEVA
ncbi:MAG: response regulator transcription factor [Deltaproteobacteria bacterium]|nr:response regulator transcription factor [Deltaproteobacteria bacterium]